MLKNKPDTLESRRAQPPREAWPGPPRPVDEASIRCSALRRSPATALWYVLAIVVVVGVPAAAVFVLGPPDLALPSDWREAQARIDDGTYPAGYIVDIVSAVLLLAWAAGVCSPWRACASSDWGHQRHDRRPDRTATANPTTGPRSPCTAKTLPCSTSVHRRVPAGRRAAR